MIPTLSIALIVSDQRTRNDIAGTIKAFGGQAGIVATANDLQACMGSMQSSKPHIVVLEVRDVDQGVREVSFMVAEWPQTTVFVVTEGKNPDWILRLIRAGASEYLTKPISTADLTEAIRKVERQIGRANGESRGGAAIAVYNPSGGMGTTTVAVNLAAALAAQGERVALVDLNLFCGNVTSFLDLTPRYTLTSVTTNMGRVDANFVMSVMDRHSSGVHVLSAPIDFEECAEVTPEHVEELITVLRAAFTYTVIDTGGPLSRCNRAVFACSDHILYTTVLDLPSLKNARRYLSVLNNESEGRLKLVVNRHVPRGDIKIADAEKILGRKPYITVPNGYSDVTASINKGEPVIACYPRSPVTKAMSDLAHLLKLETVKNSSRY